MLSVYQSGKRVINVDESWIPHADFRQRRWARRDSRNTAPDKTLSRKINIITAMSSDGEVWMALTTCNTDTNVLMLFMSHLAKALTKESVDWRNNTVFLLDGVSNSADSLMHSSIIGILPQVGRGPCLLSVPRVADHPQRSVQLQRSASGILVCTSETGRSQP